MAHGRIHYIATFQVSLWKLMTTQVVDIISILQMRNWGIKSIMWLKLHMLDLNSVLVSQLMLYHSALFIPSKQVCKGLPVFPYLPQAAHTIDQESLNNQEIRRGKQYVQVNLGMNWVCHHVYPTVPTLLLGHCLILGYIQDPRRWYKG